MEAPLSAIDNSGPSTEVIAGSVVGAVAAAILIALGVFFVQRYYAAHEQRIAQTSATQYANHDAPLRDVTSVHVRVQHQVSETSVAESRASSHSRASSRSHSSRAGTSNQLTLTSTVIDLDDVDVGASAQPQMEEVGERKRSADSASHAPSSRSAAASSLRSKASSGERTPVASVVQVRRSTGTAASHHSCPSLRGRAEEATVAVSAQGRRRLRRSRSRSRSSPKLMLQSVASSAALTSRSPTSHRAPRRSHSTKSVHGMELRANPTQRNERKFSDHTEYYSSRHALAMRAEHSPPMPSKPLTAQLSLAPQPDTVTSARPPMRPKNVKSRAQRRKTTQCVFSPRDVSSPPPPRRDTNYNMSKSASTSKCHLMRTSGARPIERDELIASSKHLEQQQVTSSRSRKLTCPLQTPNCSKEEIKDSELPLHVINPRDSDLSFTVDIDSINDDELLPDSLSVFCAPRLDVVTPQPSYTNYDTSPPTPDSLSSTSEGSSRASTPTAHVQVTSAHVQLEEAQLVKPPIAPRYNALQPNSQHSPPQHSTLPSSSTEPAFTLPAIPTDLYRHDRPRGRRQPEQVLVPRIVDSLDQLPLMVPVFKLSVADFEALQRASGSWRSFSSDTSLDSTPV